MHEPATLPVDVVDAVAAFLTGFDLLWLSHASPALFRGHLKSDSDVWTSHGAVSSQWTRAWWARGAASDSTRKDNKARYCENVSFCFRGQVEDLNYGGRRQGEIKIKMEPLSACESHAMAVDIWFALLPGSDMCGTLLSAELKQKTDRRSTRTSREVVRLDEYNNLYCSFYDDHIVMKSNLLKQRWYHLAITFQYDTDTDTSTQNVYIDGELKLSQESPAKTLLNSESEDSTTRLFLGGTRGMFKFGGLIDECRVWRSELASSQIESLYNNTPNGFLEEGCCVWSLKETETAAAKGEIGLVQCTRPCEKYCSSVRPRFVIHQE